MELFETLSADDIYAWILMNRSGDSRGILLAESGYDCQVLDAHLSSESMVTIACGGKQTVIDVMETIESQSFPAVCALVDADVDAFLQEPLPIDVYTTDSGDLDADAFFCAEGGHKFVARLLPPGTNPIVVAQEVERVVALAFAVGTLRLVSVRDGLRLSTAKPPFGAVMYQKPGHFVDLQKLADLIVRRSHQPLLCATCAERTMSTALSCDPARELGACNGHDLADALAITVRRLGGPPLSGKTMEALLKALLHQCSVFSAFTFFAKIDAWGKRHGIAVWHFACKDS